MAAPPPEKAVGVLTGHAGPIHALAFSSGSAQYLLSGSSDRNVILWNPSKAPRPGKTDSSSSTQSRPSFDSRSRGSKSTTAATSPAHVQTFTGAHTREVLDLAVSNDNSHIASAAADKAVVLWDVSTAKQLRRYGGHGGKVECVKFCGEGDSMLVTGGFDAVVRFWDLRSGGGAGGGGVGPTGGRAVMELKEAGDSVMDVRMLSGMGYGEAGVVAGGVDGRCRWYDIRKGMVWVDVLGQPITSLTPSRDANSVLISTLDSTIRLLDRSNGKLLKSLKDEGSYQNKEYRVRSTLYGNDAYVLSGSEDGYVYAWDVVTGRRLSRVRHCGESEGARGRGRVVSAVASRKGGWASAGGDGDIMVWS